MQSHLQVDLSEQRDGRPREPALLPRPKPDDAIAPAVGGLHDVILGDGGADPEEPCRLDADAFWKVHELVALGGADRLARLDCAADRFLDRRRPDGHMVDIGRGLRPIQRERGRQAIDGASNTEHRHSSTL